MFIVTFGITSILVLCGDMIGWNLIEFLGNACYFGSVVAGLTLSYMRYREWRITVGLFGVACIAPLLAPLLPRYSVLVLSTGVLLFFMSKRILKA